MPERLAAGTLVLVVLMPPEQLRNHSLHFLRELSRLLHTNVVFKRDASGQQMIFPYYGREEELHKHPIRRSVAGGASLLPGGGGGAGSGRRRRELDPMDVRGCEPGPAALGAGPGGGGGEARVLGRAGAATALPATSPRPRLLTPRPHLTEVSSGGPRALEDSVLSRGQGCSWGSGDHGAGGRHGYQRCLAGAGAGRGDGPGPAHLRGFSRPDPAPCPGFREPPLPIGTMPQGQGCPWRRLSGRTRTGLGSHPLTGCPPRSIVYLEIDNRQCVQSSSQCFQSATDVAAFLGALASLGSLNIPYKIEAVQSEWPACCPSLSPSGRVAWVGRGPLRGAASQRPPSCSGAFCHPQGRVTPSRVWEVLFWRFLPGTLPHP